MSATSRSQLNELFQKYRYGNGKDVSVSERSDLSAFLNAAFTNTTRNRTGPVFRRTFQASFRSSANKSNRLQLQPVELRSFLVLDLNDGGQLFLGSQGLIDAIKTVGRNLFVDLDAVAMRQSAEVSIRTDLPVRVKVASPSALTTLGVVTKDFPKAKLVANIPIGSHDARPEDSVTTARRLKRMGAGFALTNVVNDARLSMHLDHLTTAYLHAESIDLDLKVVRNLGERSAAGYEAEVDTAGILAVTNNHAHNVSVSGVAIEPVKRQGLFSAARSVHFDLDQLRVSGRDLMPEVLLVDELPTPAVERSTGLLLSI